MTGSRFQPDPADIALFHASVGRVHPIKSSQRIPPDRQRAHIPARRRDEQTTPAGTPRFPNLSDHIYQDIPDQYRHNGVSQKYLKRLQQGYWPIQARLDLHGLDTGTARQALLQFLHQAVADQQRAALVIHGKGYHSQNNLPVLRQLTRHWLCQHPHVLAYCNAPARLGGQGAVLILLKISS